MNWINEFLIKLSQLYVTIIYINNFFIWNPKIWEKSKKIFKIVEFKNLKWLKFIPHFIYIYISTFHFCYPTVTRLNLIFKQYYYTLIVRRRNWYRYSLKLCFLCVWIRNGQSHGHRIPAVGWRNHWSPEEEEAWPWFLCPNDQGNWFLQLWPLGATR